MAGWSFSPEAGQGCARAGRSLAAVAAALGPPPSLPGRRAVVVEVERSVLLVIFRADVVLTVRQHPRRLL